MAFYRIHDGKLTSAEGPLFGPGFDLLPADHELYEYPVGGWYWFDTDVEANHFFDNKI